MTVATFVLAEIAIHHGFGNHLPVVEESGQLQKCLLFTWLTIFVFNIALPIGKIAVSSFLLEIVGFTSEYQNCSECVQHLLLFHWISCSVASFSHSL